jgi:hypothetical protein
MRSTRAGRRLVRGALLLALMFWSTACFHYTPVGALPRTTRLPNDLRVELYDGRIELLSRSQMVSDTIVGVRTSTGSQIRIPLAHVDAIEVKTFSLVDSLIAGGIAVTLFYYMVRGIANRPMPGPRSGM